MIIGESKCKKWSAKLSEKEENDIKMFIKGAVYGYCNNCIEEDGNYRWFSAFTLFGKDNYYWETPLVNLYNYHKNNAKDNKTAISLSGQDLGYLLKTVLIDDDRKYEINSQQRKYKVNSYRPVKEE